MLLAEAKKDSINKRNDSQFGLNNHLAINQNTLFNGIFNLYIEVVYAKTGFLHENKET